ncbi:ParB N-terminal domain-containing protein [Gulosibacter sediminis]|uniref:ParB N-terminal domain-containing protein n=1 Tax=Gulosibacter sediminis TaxID=1729695 RepID=UPI0018688CF9|nr:ParB N-terminal domain-containing protein [Gulosibacter sediminis]
MSTPGHIELDRAVDSLHVGRRHRADLGDIDALAASIERDGLLQPLTVSPDGVLICGARRLAAIKQLGWRTVNVWVRSGISDRLGHLLAEQDDNVLHKPLTSLEAAALYRELKSLMAEDAARRKAATQFRSDNQPGTDGVGNFPAPSTPTGRASEQAAGMIPGGASYKTLDKIGYLEHAATDETLPEHVRAAAQRGLEQIDAGSPVHPIYETIRNHATSPADEALHQAAADALARIQSAGRPKPTSVKKPKDDAEGVPVQYPVRAFVVTWTELDQWWTHYDPAVLAAELTDEQVATFLRVIEHTIAFADALQAALTNPDDTTAASDPVDERDDAPAGGRPQLRAI